MNPKKYLGLVPALFASYVGGCGLLFSVPGSSSFRDYRLLVPSIVIGALLGLIAWWLIKTAPPDEHDAT